MKTTTNHREEKTFQIGVVEDLESHRDKIREIFAPVPDFKEPIFWTSGEECWSDRRELSVDLLFIDIELKHMKGTELTRMMHGEFPKLPIAMLTAFSSDELIFQALKAGALGYILKNELDEIVRYARIFLAGGAIMTPSIALRVYQSFQPSPEVPNLTKRERQVLQLLIRGKTGTQIARELQVSPNTVHTHNKNIYAKLEVSSKVEMMNRLSDMNLI